MGFFSTYLHFVNIFMKIMFLSRPKTVFFRKSSVRYYQQSFRTRNFKVENIASPIPKPVSFDDKLKCFPKNPTRAKLIFCVTLDPQVTSSMT